jgi:hypothetical protein
MSRNSSSTARQVTETALCEWLGSARPGEQLAYYRGFLAIDCDPATGRLPERARAELMRVARRARRASDLALAHLVQQRHAPDDYTYILVARTKPRLARSPLSDLFQHSSAPRETVQ